MEPTYDANSGGTGMKSKVQNTIVLVRIRPVTPNSHDIIDDSEVKVLNSREIQVV